MIKYIQPKEIPILFRIKKEGLFIMKVKLFTHTDLDGCGCAIITKMAYKDVDIEFCDYDNVNERVENFYIGSSKNNYDKVFITDISVNEDVANIIEYYKDAKYYPEIKLFDHHKTAEWLNKYEWVSVSEWLESDVKNSGTSMLNNYLKNNPYGIAIYNFSEKVRQYDTWEWKTKYNDIEPKLINDLFQIQGRDLFIHNVIYQFNRNEEFTLSEEDNLLLKSNQEKIDKYINERDKILVTKMLNKHKVGVVFAEQYQSELGNTLSERHPELDYVIIINLSKAISYRTIKDGVDLSVIAKSYGGGGHPYASGSPIGDYTRNEIINLMFG